MSWHASSHVSLSPRTSLGEVLLTGLQYGTSQIPELLLRQGFCRGMYRQREQGAACASLQQGAGLLQCSWLLWVQAYQ